MNSGGIAVASSGSKSTSGEGRTNGTFPRFTQRILTDVGFSDHNARTLVGHNNTIYAVNLTGPKTSLATQDVSGLLDG